MKLQNLYVNIAFMCTQLLPITDINSTSGEIASTESVSSETFSAQASLNTDIFFWTTWLLGLLANVSAALTTYME